MLISRLSGIACVLLGVTACTSTIQTTSGADYLAAYENRYTPAVGGESGVDAQIKSIAAIEPQLHFPARIGLARIERRQLSAIPVSEMEIWADTVSTFGPEVGEFVPVSPLIASMVTETRRRSGDHAGKVVEDIRKGAARQHLDYVIAYEVTSFADAKANALSLADLSVIGMFVIPSRSIDVEASVSAIMLDVRNGYPYATITGFAEKGGISTAVTQRSSRYELMDTAEGAALRDVTRQMKDVMTELRIRAAKATLPRQPSDSEFKNKW